LRADAPDHIASDRDRLKDRADQARQHVIETGGAKIIAFARAVAVKPLSPGSIGSVALSGQRARQP
jgi:hypothetical protein